MIFSRTKRAFEVFFRKAFFFVSQVLSFKLKKQTSKNVADTTFKDKKLVGHFPEDQVLHVLWGIEDDAFGFKVALKNKATTKRGV